MWTSISVADVDQGAVFWGRALVAMGRVVEELENALVPAESRTVTRMPMLLKETRRYIRGRGNSICRQVGNRG